MSPDPKARKARAPAFISAGFALVGASALACASWFASESRAAPMAAQSPSALTLSQMESFIVQAPNALPGSTPSGFQQASAPIIWRKHDWPGRGDRAGRPQGYQASDSVEEDLSDGRLYVQTFDFGDGGRLFQHFDSNGDGGQALVAMNGSIYAALTEDGGGGVQWFVGHGCRSSAGAEGGLRGWLFFSANADRGAWHDRVARLNIERRESSCPWFFNQAYTRWRRADVSFPYKMTGSGAPERQGTFVVDSIISEHYGGSSIAAADHLERSWFGRGYGLLRWERWENAARSSRPDLDMDAADLADSGRCGPVAGSVSPGPDWRMVDCRTWTNFVRLAKPWKVADFNWPRADALKQFESAFAGR